MHLICWITHWPFVISAHCPPEWQFLLEHSITCLSRNHKSFHNFLLNVLCSISNINQWHMRLICYPELLPVVPPDTGSCLMLLFIFFHIVIVQNVKEKPVCGQKRFVSLLQELFLLWSWRRPASLHSGIDINSGYTHHSQGALSPHKWYLLDRCHLF